MRPLQLKLTGINSYREEQIIDFETLTSQGLFGIFGPTGSGKSSILDAMTLALYAKLPRDTKNFINTNEKKANVSFLFSITTDKTRKYLAERSFRYHTGNSVSTVRNTTGRLILYEGDTVYFRVRNGIDYSYCDCLAFTINTNPYSFAEPVEFPNKAQV